MDETPRIIDKISKQNQFPICLASWWLESPGFLRYACSISQKKLGEDRKQLHNLPFTAVWCKITRPMASTTSRNAVKQRITIEIHVVPEVTTNRKTTTGHPSTILSSDPCNHAFRPSPSPREFPHPNVDQTPNDRRVADARHLFFAFIKFQSPSERTPQRLADLDR